VKAATQLLGRLQTSTRSPLITILTGAVSAKKKFAPADTDLSRPQPRRVLPCGHPDTITCPLCLDKTLENIIDYVIRLASENRTTQISRPRPLRRRNTQVTRNRPYTPHPSPPQRLSKITGEDRSQTPSPPSSAPRVITNQDTPLINQRIQGAPAFPSIHTTICPFVAFAERTPSSNDTHNIRLRARQLDCYYPDGEYLSKVLPTCNHQELLAFQQYCFDQYQTSAGQDLTYNHGIEQIYEFSTSPLNFENLLWRTKITLGPAGIIEEYAYIRRHSQNNGPDCTYLEQAFIVNYPWSTDGWTVTQVIRRNRI
jgi:hypothetical protein